LLGLQSLVQHALVRRMLIEQHEVRSTIAEQEAIEDLRHEAQPVEALRRSRSRASAAASGSPRAGIGCGALERSRLPVDVSGRLAIVGRHRRSICGPIRASGSPCRSLLRSALVTTR
jgi:hypothetical protein